MTFAKLFGTGDDQVLVKIDSNEKGPEVRFYFKPRGMGVCALASSFEDSDEGWDAAEEAFAQVDEATARRIANEILQVAQPLQG
jgi:hypothetical protein